MLLERLGVSIFDNSADATSAHDVTAAYCLAMADVRVRFPLGALDLRVWESLVFRVLRAHEIAGSNPAILTDDCGAPCLYGRAAVNRFVAGSIPASAAYENGGASRWATAAASTAVEPFHDGLEGSTPSPSAGTCALGRAAEVPSFQPGEAGSTPAGHFHWVGSSAAEQVPVKHQRAGSSPARPSEIDAG